MDYYQDCWRREEGDALQWTFAKRLEDLDFTDDMVLLAQRQTGMQGKTDDAAARAGQIGLEANAHVDEQ